MNVINSLQCRICLAYGAEISLFGSEESKEIVSKLSQCIHEQLEDRDGYPRHICTSCNNTLNTVCNFLKTFRESNILLENASKTIVKEEFVDITDYNDDNVYDCGIEVKHETTTLKKEPKIEFDNAQQFSELVKQFQLDTKKEPKKIKKEPKSKIKKENRKTKTNLVKKRAKAKLGTERADSIVEGSKSEKILIKEEVKTVDIEFDKNTKETEKKKKEPRTVLCDLCGDVFNSADQLRKHQDSIHFKHAVQCPLCPRTCSKSYDLNRHIRRVHSKEGRDFICSVCGKAYLYKSDLAVHYKSTHEKHLLKKKKYPCKLCDRTFACAKSVVVHERSAHTGERPVVCSICDSRFYHKDYLKEHMRLHTGETPFKCPICSRSYAQSGNMKSHIRHRHSISQIDELTLKTLKPNILKLMKP